MNIGSISSGFNTFSMSSMRASSRATGSEDAEQRLSDLTSKIMEKKDADGNDGISLEELDGLGIDEESFAAIDSDGDGLVSQDERKAEHEQRMTESGAGGVAEESGTQGGGMFASQILRRAMQQYASPEAPALARNIHRRFRENACLTGGTTPRKRSRPKRSDAGCAQAAPGHAHRFAPQAPRQHILDGMRPEQPPAP